MIKEPTVYINESIVRKNIRTIHKKIKQQNKQFRPHFKTHQSAVIGKWFKAENVKFCAVSSLSMAWYFAKNGWNDIMLAFPMNPALCEDYEWLASKIKLELFLSDVSVIQYFKKIINPVNIRIEINTGQNRSGLNMEDIDLIQKTISEIKKNTIHRFSGFAVHAGETYHAQDTKQIKTIHYRNMEYFQKLKLLTGNVNISYGDTPSISLMEDFQYIDELRPGNFVFYDWMQNQLGTCLRDDIAIYVKCPVVAVYPERNEAIIHGGAVHFSKESIMASDGYPVFGLVTRNSEANNTDLGYLKSLSQEHGVVKLYPGVGRNLKAGDTVSVIPVHSCLVADMATHYLEASSGQVIEKMKK
ncbi:MAG: alanine racemase [Bacteroidales bacterium]|nr:alanine racemase [Bacteroidales bacterium]